uniref:Uncharacterized protein n=1 Tax=Rhizophagus irregularis (strain DAOM 181602 / DAOM 197198 / MUCL 43194) TaxID=747089 RepID=U9TCL1_RHIID
MVRSSSHIQAINTYILTEKKRHKSQRSFSVFKLLNQILYYTFRRFIVSSSKILEETQTRDHFLRNFFIGEKFPSTYFPSYLGFPTLCDIYSILVETFFSISSSIEQQ